MSSYINLAHCKIEISNPSGIMPDPIKPSLTYSGSTSIESWFQQEWKAPSKAAKGKKKFWERA